jgi:hypothetical protein
MVTCSRVYLAVFKAVAVGLAEDAIETGEIDITGMSPAESWRNSKPRSFRRP